MLTLIPQRGTCLKGTEEFYCFFFMLLNSPHSYILCMDKSG